MATFCALINPVGISEADCLDILLQCSASTLYLHVNRPRSACHRKRPKSCTPSQPATGPTRISSWSWFTMTCGDWPGLRCRPHLLLLCYNRLRWFTKSFADHECLTARQCADALETRIRNANLVNEFQHPRAIGQCRILRIWRTPR